MDGYKFPPNSRVRLRDGVDPSFYHGMAKTGNEGWVVARRKDNLGFPEIYIKWDPEHWAYNRQPDCWTYEGHFELVEMKRYMDNDKKKQAAHDLASQFADGIARLFSDDNQAEPVPEPEREAESVHVVGDTPFASKEERYTASLQKAIQMLQQDGLESFVIVGVVRNPHRDAPKGELRTIVAHDTLSTDAEIAVGAQTAQIAAQFHEASAILNLVQMSEEQSGSDEHQAR